MSEEWRTLPEFPKYEITSDGDVRNKWTKKKLNEVHNKKTGAYSYSLRREDGSSTCRNHWGLVVSAFPEYSEKKVVQVEKSTRSYAKRNQWVDIPGFPTYQAHPDGLVRYKVSKRHRKVLHDVTNTPYYRLFNEYGDSNRLTVRRILRICFPEPAEQDAA
jgi:hypothetical protein